MEQLELFLHLLLVAVNLHWYIMVKKKNCLTLSANYEHMHTHVLGIVLLDVFSAEMPTYIYQKSWLQSTVGNIRATRTQVSINKRMCK